MYAGKAEELLVSVANGEGAWIEPSELIDPDMVDRMVSRPCTLPLQHAGWATAGQLDKRLTACQAMSQGMRLQQY
jgi:hypothetical protein